MSTQPHPVPPSDRVIVYVDGFNLYFGLRAALYQRFYWLDIHRLSQNLLAPGQLLEDAKYFTSRISGPAPGDQSAKALSMIQSRQRQTLYLEALGTTGVRIIEGHFLDKGGRCKTCGATWPSFEEKMTDVNIATEMLTDAFTDRFDTALVISADSDLVPPIRALRTHFPKKRVVAVFPPKRASKEIRNAAHAYLTIGPGLLAGSLLPPQVAKPNGHVLHRPGSWT